MPDTNDALAAARAALAALDKANADGDSAQSSKAELDAARQALSRLGGRPADDGDPSATEWALPVVDAPPSRFDVPDEAPAPQPAPTRIRPPRASDGTADDWAAPVLDAPVPDAPAPAPSREGTTPATPAPSSTPVRPPRASDGSPDDWAAPVLDAPAPAATPDDTERPTPEPPPAPRTPAEPFAPEPDDATLAAIRDALTAGDAPVRLAEPALSALGPDAADMLREDPWCLLALPGTEPRQADLFAAKSLTATPDPDEPRRTVALVLWLLARAAADGHTAVDASSIAAALAEQGVRDGATALRSAHEAGRVMAFAERPFVPVDEFDDAMAEFDPDDPFDGPADRVLVALERHALAEESIADAVLRLTSTAELDETATPFGTSGVVAYVTGPGEDPPSAPLAYARTVASSGAEVHVLSPTNDGRTRLAAAFPDAATVHDVLSAGESLLDAHLVVLTEAHLLDPQTAASLLEAVPDGARVILCGDPDELEPALPGRVFADIKDSGAVPVITSTARAEGVLGSLAAAVRGGSLPPVESPDRQVVLVGARAASEAVHRCVQLVGDSIPRALGIEPDDVLVVTPAEDGSAGTTALNAALKARLNPGPGRYAGFDIGDRVVRVPVPRATGLLEGRVVAAEADGLAVAFRAGPPVTVPRARLDELRHGWAVTVRQALGVRRPGVVAMLPGDAGPLVTRALVYTAFTRAQRHLSVVYPAGGTLPEAVARESGSVRTTRLATALREAAGEG